MRDLIQKTATFSLMIKSDVKTDIIIGQKLKGVADML